LPQVRVCQPALLALFAKHADSKGKQAKLKSPAQLQELLDICRSTLAVSGLVVCSKTLVLHA
jgi:inositol hexakisphosphate/diphosphoinositol-pentakisphosphate kinase